MLKNTLLFLFLSILLVKSAYGQQSNETGSRWQIAGNQSIEWLPLSDLPHHDHIEMSGKRISAILRYGVTADTGFKFSATVVWPSFRTLPNNTGASYNRIFPADAVKYILFNGKSASEKVKKTTLNGTLETESITKENAVITRCFYPSPDKPVFMEEIKIKNLSHRKLTLEIPNLQIQYYADSLKVVEGPFTAGMKFNLPGTYTLEQHDSVTVAAFYFCTRGSKAFVSPNIIQEKALRLTLLKEWNESLKLETPDTVLNTAFEFAKIRAAESIFETKGGLMHSPGGESYYAAIWANDQAEYIGPFFPFLGYKTGNEASLNAYLLFSKFMNKEYKPIPSSIIAEGLDVWNGRGDRGDQAMLAYGAARFALTSGNTKTAEQLWPLVEWCLAYLHLKLNKQGVPTSDCDELELRFPAGTANLSTASLYYDALHSAVYLGKSLNKNPRQLTEYKNRARALEKSIESYFGSKVENFDTYRYYEGNDVLRAWICMPLSVGIFNRKEGTIDALFSQRLWTNDGLATQAGKITFWDRSTLYALKGIMMSGEREPALKYLIYYSNRRLLGEHVPYPIEAFPEGNQKHLSAESGLYCRIFTEGMFGIRPTGLNSFTLTPQLPDQWNTMALRKIKAFGKDFDIEISRLDAGKINVRVSASGNTVIEKAINNGSELKVKF